MVKVLLHRTAAASPQPLICRTHLIISPTAAAVSEFAWLSLASEAAEREDSLEMTKDRYKLLQPNYQVRIKFLSRQSKCLFPTGPYGVLPHIHHSGFGTW